jgi:O-antigen/teichoic acid export membrane protein
MKPFLLRYLFFSLLLAIALYLLGTVDMFSPVMLFAWICYAVFFVLTFLTFYMAARSMNGRFQNFMNIFFLGIIIKLFITGAVVVIYKSTAPDEEVSSVMFALPFALVYFSFLAFETSYLVKLSKAAEKSK